MKKIIQTSLALACVGPAFAATLVNIDFNSAGGAAGTYNGATAPVLGNNGDTWNGVTVAAGAPAGKTVLTSTLVTSDNQASTVGVSITTFNNSSDLSATAPYNTNIGATFRPLMIDYIYLYTVQGHSTATITITGLNPSSTGSIVLFGANTANQGSTFTIDAISKTTSDTGNIGSALVENDEYVRFDNLTASPTGTISILWTVPAGHQFAGLNGMQINFVPEPSVALLGGLGMLGLLRRRR